MTYQIEGGVHNRLSMKDKLNIVAYYKINGGLTRSDAKVLGKALGLKPTYIETVKQRVWFKEYCEIWDLWKSHEDEAQAEAKAATGS